MGDLAVPSGPLGEYLATHLEDGTGGPVTVERVGEGRSNLTYRVNRGGRVYILRRPPLGELPETAHDMMREFRVLSGLAGSGVRAPRPVLACRDTAILGVPFYLMEVVEGVVIRTAPPEAWAEGERRRIGEELVDALAELHRLDVDAAGLGDVGRPDGYAARQIVRWTRQWAVMQTRALPDVDAIRGWLEEHLPESGTSALVHGDYKLDNVVFGRDPPARLRAILDWEMATLGDPLADLGYLLLFWPEPGEEQVGGLPQPSQLPGFPPRSALLARYEERTGLITRGLTFYRTLALWKLAIVCEGLYKRHLAGNAQGRWYALLETEVPQMAARARSWCGA